MKDFLLRDIEVGDFVITTSPGYKSFMVGRIKSFTEKRVYVQFKNNYGKIDDILRDPRDLVKVDGPELTKYFLVKD